MTSDNTGTRNVAPQPAAPAAAQPTGGRNRFPTGVAVVAGLVGLVLGTRPPSRSPD
ncbi:MAG TPA: hypothetical protein VME67_10875 [Mycobacterium sp.]|nr:hypothetical protein [Mycobacterium sp.]HTX95297.1 hypothetical protein [Mycobacterium sp.]